MGSDTDELLRRIRRSVAENAYTETNSLLDQLTAILNERLLPGLSIAFSYKEISFGNERGTVHAEIGEDLAGPTPRAAVLAAISRIEGEKA